jgi:alkaline phosphatase D
MPNRRTVLQGAVALAANAGLIGRAAGQAKWTSDPFQLGVASGCPRPDGFVLWTRLAPDPLSADPATPGGMTGGDVPVTYEVATDPAMRNIARHGRARAEAAFAHSVHEQVSGLSPGRDYWYRFTSGGAQSRIGHVRTAPAIGAATERMRFGFVSCSNYEFGYFSAYRHLAAEDPALIIFLGDYIYEHIDPRAHTRRHSDNAEAKTLQGYRNRYAQYRLDPDLQTLHAAAAALATWDDHEVQNDYADQWSQTFDPPEIFLARRATAYQAFYEHMPVQPHLSRPNGPAMRVYDRFAFGDLVAFHLIDGRQYRSREACYAPPDKGRAHAVNGAICPELLQPGRSMLGRMQEAWLFDGLSRSRARWNILAQDVLMTRLRERQGDGSFDVWSDDWNGYPASRTRVLQHIRDSRVANPVVIGGDIHSFWANELKLDFDDARAPVIATELVGTSITSPPGPEEMFRAYVRDNPNVKFFDGRHRGYVCADILPARMESRFQIVSDVTDPKATRSTLATAVIEDGRAGVSI